MLNYIFTLPKRNLTLTVPVVLLIGYVVGLFVDTSSLAVLILPITIIMIYPTMIGFQPKHLLNLSHGRLTLVAFILNFIILPIVAFIIGKLFLTGNPQLFAGLAISALLPTSNMTIAYTMFARGNVPAAIKLTVLSLILGSILTPWYLLLMVGQYISIDVLVTARTIAIVVFLPMILGVLTYKQLLKRYSQQEFERNIKPILPSISSWGMVCIFFISMSMNSHRILSQTEILKLAILGQFLFYFCNYLLTIILAKKLFNREDGCAFVFSSTLRNLSIALGLAATAFGPDAAFMVTIAFLIQPQAAAWFMRLNEKYRFLT